MEFRHLHMTIPSFKKGGKLWAADLQSLADAVRANRVLPGVGIRITGSPNGTTVAVAPGGGAGASGMSFHPFKVVVSKNDGQSVRVQVIFGTVNGIEPTIGGQWLHNVRPTPPTLPVDDGSQVFLKANLDASRNVASAEVAAASEVPQNSEALSHVLLARVIVADEGGNRSVTIAQNVASSLGFRTCKNPDWYEGATDALKYQHIWWGI
jgi:hypothetical protein